MKNSTTNLMHSLKERLNESYEKISDGNNHSSGKTSTAVINVSAYGSSYPRTCEFCGKMCSYRQVFFAHRKKCNTRIRYADRRQKIVKEYVCDRCNKRFNRKFNLQKHLETAVCLKKKTNCCNGITDQTENSQFINNEELKEYSCAHCGKMFQRKSNLRRHVKRAVCSNKEIVKRCKLKCWESECSALFYKQIDLVQHLREQHGRTLTVERLEFQNYDAFASWKKTENSIKFMNARKLTGAKRSSKGLSYYYICQFYRKNKTASMKRKTSRRKTVGIVPDTKCPSRILVKECGSKIHVTYIATHNHDLYDPLEKKPLSMDMQFLVKKRHISSMKISDECVKAKDRMSWNIFCGNDDRRRTYEVSRIIETCDLGNCIVKCLDEYCQNLCEHLYRCSCSKKNIFCKHMHKVHSMLNAGVINPPPNIASAPISPANCDSSLDTSQNGEEIENQKLVLMAQSCLIKLNNYIKHKEVPEVYLKQLVRTLQSLCDQCDNLLLNGKTNRLPDSVYVQDGVIFEPGQKLDDKLENDCRRERSFTASITNSTDLLQPLFQPFKINVLHLKSLDPIISERELVILRSADSSFTVGCVNDAIIDCFMDIVCTRSRNVYVANTKVSQLLMDDQVVPQIWNVMPWNTIDIIFIPCKLSRMHWLLLIIHLREPKLFVLDPTPTSESNTVLFKKCQDLVNSWYNILRSFFGIQYSISSFPYTKQNSPENSGVLICWYVFQYVHKYSLTDPLNVYQFRKFIHDTIVSGTRTSQIQR